MSELRIPCGSPELHIPDCPPSACELGTKNITTNGTFNANDDDLDGYSSVTVAVPNTFTESDNGKVVQGGALVPQTSRTITENGTYDTTTNNAVTVDVETEPNLQAKTTNVNGIVFPDEGYDGLSQVTVDVTYGYKSPHAFGTGVFYLAALLREEEITQWYLNPTTHQLYPETIPNDDNVLEWSSSVSTGETEPTPQYNISVLATPLAGGSVRGGGQYWQGETVTVVASTSSGYTFNGWYHGDTLVGTNSTYSFVASADLYLSARFEEIAPILVIGTEQGVERISAGSIGTISMRLSHMPVTGTNIVVVLRMGTDAIDAGTWTAGTAKTESVGDFTVSYDGVNGFTLNVSQPQTGSVAINSITYSYYK